MQIDYRDLCFFQGREGGEGEDVHPACADHKVWFLGEDELGEVGVVEAAGVGDVCWVTVLVGHQVVVGCGDAGVGGAGESVGGFLVGDDVRDAAWERGGVGGVDEGLEVRAGAGDEDEDRGCWAVGLAGWVGGEGGKGTGVGHFCVLCVFLRCG